MTKPTQFKHVYDTVSVDLNNIVYDTLSSRPWALYLYFL